VVECSIGIGFGFQAADDGECVFVVLGVNVLNVIHPVEVLHGLILIGGTKADVVLGKAIEETVELLLDKGQVVFLQDNDVLPAVLLADGESWATGKQSIQEQTDRQSGEASLDPFSQSVEGFEFTVLLGGVLAGVLNELGHQGEDESIAGDQFRL
jgi:hypothetical protein